MKKKVLILFLLLSVLVGCSNKGENVYDAVHVAHQGIQNILAAYEAGLQIKETLIDNQKEVDDVVKNKLIENYQSSFQLSQTNFKEALAIYEKTVKQDRQNAFMLNNLGHTYMWLNKKDLAQKNFEQALKYCKSNSLKESIEHNRNFIPNVKQYYSLFEEVNKYINQNQ